MLFKRYGDAAMDMVEMDADRQAYEDQAEYNATRPLEAKSSAKVSTAMRQVVSDSIPF